MINFSITTCLRHIVATDAGFIFDTNTENNNYYTFYTRTFYSIRWKESMEAICPPTPTSSSNILWHRLWADIHTWIIVKKSIWQQFTVVVGMIRKKTAKWKCYCCMWLCHHRLLTESSLPRGAQIVGITKHTFTIT